MACTRVASQAGLYQGSLPQARIITGQRTGGGFLKRSFRAARARVYYEEGAWGHHPGDLGPPVRDLTEQEKERRVQSATERIKRQTEQRGKNLQEDAHKAHLDHELKFGKLMLSQGSLDSALAHFDKVISGSGELSYHRGEATLQKAACLELMGREDEARHLYESLIQFRAPYPNIKRRAAQALFGPTASSEEGGGVKGSTSYEEYMYRMFLSGFGHYLPKEKYVETEEEKTVMRVLPWAILLMAPVLLIWLVLFPK